jgi:hypothetical protein
MGFFKSLFETNVEKRCEEYRSKWKKSKELSEKELEKIIAKKFDVDVALFAFLAVHRKSFASAIALLERNHIPFKYALNYVERFFSNKNDNATRFFEIGQGDEFEEIRNLVATLIPLMRDEIKKREFEESEQSSIPSIDNDDDPYAEFRDE